MPFDMKKAKGFKKSAKEGRDEIRMREKMTKKDFVSSVKKARKGLKASQKRARRNFR